MRAVPLRGRTLLRRFATQERGSSAVVTAVLAVVLLWCAALAVDVGSLYFERRTAQGAVDLAAIAAARDIEAAERAAIATLEANNIRYIHNLDVVRGNYRPDPAVPANARFTANLEPFNAVIVTLRQQAPLHLASALMGARTMEIGTRAVAVQTEQAAFSIGSRLLRLEGGLVNALFGALLGGSLSLTAMDYEALADANVKLFDFMDALATELDLEGASYDDVLNANATVADVINAAATAAAASGHAAAANALLDLAGAGTGHTVPLDGVIDLGPYGNFQGDSAAPGFDPSINVMQMVSAAAAVANGGNQVSLNLGAAIPGLADVRVDVAIGEPMRHAPWMRVGEHGAIVRTVQTRVRVIATAGGSAAGLPLSVRIPLYTEIAYAEGRLEDIRCGPDPARDAEVDVAARPGVAELWLGEIDPDLMDDFSRDVPVNRADLVGTPLARVTGRAHAEATNVSETILTFDARDIAGQRIKSTATRDAVTTLLASLVQDLDIDVHALGLGLGLPGGLEQAVAGVVSAAAPALDTVLSGVLDALGISLGETDIAVRGVRCDGAALVG